MKLDLALPAVPRARQKGHVAGAEAVPILMLMLKPPPTPMAEPLHCCLLPLQQSRCLDLKSRENPYPQRAPKRGPAGSGAVAEGASAWQLQLYLTHQLRQQRQKMMMSQLRKPCWDCFQLLLFLRHRSKRLEAGSTIAPL